MSLTGNTYYNQQNLENSTIIQDSLDDLYLKLSGITYDNTTDTTNITNNVNITKNLIVNGLDVKTQIETNANNIDNLIVDVDNLETDVDNLEIDLHNLEDDFVALETIVNNIDLPYVLTNSNVANMDINLSTNKLLYSSNIKIGNSSTGYGSNY